MKIKEIFFTVPIIFIFVLIVGLSGCGNSDKKTDKADDKKNTLTKTDTLKKVIDGKYVCPMHPMEQSNEAGKCSICKMNLVSKEEHGKQMNKKHEEMEKKYEGKEEINHHEIKISSVKSDECEKYIKDALQKDAGIVDYQIDIINNLVHVMYDKTKIAKDKIDQNISNAGFDANDRKANPDVKSKLPDECK